jgi:hypothetical protein
MAPGIGTRPGASGPTRVTRRVGGRERVHRRRSPVHARGHASPPDGRRSVPGGSPRGSRHGARPIRVCAGRAEAGSGVGREREAVRAPHQRTGRTRRASVLSGIGWGCEPGLPRAPRRVRVGDSKSNRRAGPAPSSTSGAVTASADRRGRPWLADRAPAGSARGPVARPAPRRRPRPIPRQPTSGPPRRAPRTHRRARSGIHRRRSA